MPSPSATPNFGLPNRYQSRSRPEYFVDSDGQPDSDIVWQPDVYNTVAKLAKTVGATNLIDIGCGRGGKLVALKDDFKVVGIDFGSNIEFCRKEYPYGTWEELDLEAEDAAIPLPADRLADAAIVCSDVIEHLINPVPLVQMIRKALDSGWLAVISTPERVLCKGLLDKGPPENPHHVREWALSELTNFVRSEGCDVLYSGVTRTHSRSDQQKTCLLVLRGARMTDAQASEITQSLPTPPDGLRYTWAIVQRTLRRLGRSSASKPAS